jgi:two-component system, sensor histidine kinase RegB
MPALLQPDVITTGPREPGLLRLQTLVRLRWLAVMGQAFAVLVVQFVLGFELLLGPCLGIIALSAWLNIFLTLRWRSSLRLAATPAGLLLGYDIIQLALLLYFTGGLENPFAFLFLVPVTVSAASLPLNWTVGLSALAFLCASLLPYFHFPLPWSAGAAMRLPPTYLFGMWAAIGSGLVFTTIYVRRIAQESRQMSEALNATELVLAREQRLSALDGLAAAAAHELGTPLATIALVAKEMKREAKANSPHHEDLDLLMSQAARCREILARLANREAPDDDVYHMVKMPVLIEDLVAPLRGPDIIVDIDIAPGAQSSANDAEPLFRRNPAVSYGLSNLIENAIDFAESKIQITGRWTPNQVSITVVDDGPGFNLNILDRLGDPFVTSRPGYDKDQDPERGRHEGMGLGFFIAKTLLERSGASVSLANRKAPDRGATVVVIWPRKAIDFQEPLQTPSPVKLAAAQ